MSETYIEDYDGVQAKYDNLLVDYDRLKTDYEITDKHNDELQIEIMDIQDKYDDQIDELEAEMEEIQQANSNEL